MRLTSPPPLFGVEVSPGDVRDTGEIESAVAAFARGSNSRLIATGRALAFVHRDLIIRPAAQHKPATHYERFFVTGGGSIA
jgi:hypothetical protein